MIELRQEHALEELSEIGPRGPQHKVRYGYRRITAALRRAGHLVNHKTVQRLMGELQLRIKKYQAYRGEEGQVALNLLKRKSMSNDRTRNV